VRRAHAGSDILVRARQQRQVVIKLLTALGFTTGVVDLARRGGRSKREFAAM